VVVADLRPALSMASARRGVLLLAAGATIGLGLAASGLVARERPPGVPADAVALVNGQPIQTEDYARVLAGLGSDRRGGRLEADDRQLVLDRLIEESLLVQRGLELGLPWRDPKVRKDIIASVVDAVVADRAPAAPSDAAVAAFYDANRALFARPGRLRVRQIWCAAAEPAAAPAAEARAVQAATRLRAGEDFAAVRAALGDDELSPLPDALLPPQKLADYVGPTALRTALALAAGAVADPLRSATGYHVLQVVERQPDEVPPLASIRDEVLAEMRRRAGDDALRAYVAELRRGATIETRTP
jgi:parvulin-like peptidyl-prolyl isomerase